MRAAMQNTDLKIEVEDFGAVLSSIPMLAIYISCQKFFIESLAISGVKG